jgi:hypothetical protein
MASSKSLIEIFFMHVSDGIFRRGTRAGRDPTRVLDDMNTFAAETFPI